MGHPRTKPLLAPSLCDTSLPNLGGEKSVRRRGGSSPNGSVYNTRTNKIPIGSLAVLCGFTAILGSGIGRTVHAQTGTNITPRGTFDGPFGVFTSAASFGIDNDDDDFVDAERDRVEMVVRNEDLPTGAKIHRAYLYFGGSLFEDDDTSNDPDLRISLKVPGAANFEDVRALRYELLNNPGDIPGLSFFVAKVDVTQMLRERSLSGRYIVKDFEADLFSFGNEHPAAHAGVALVLVYEANLPNRTIVLSDGLLPVLGGTEKLVINGFKATDRPSASLTLLSFEGDPRVENAGAERVTVTGNGGQSLVLGDSLNPIDDVFNQTINTVFPPGRLPGIDLDKFDVSPALTPGDDELLLSITTPPATLNGPGELIALVFSIFEIERFEAELQPTSRIEILDQRGQPQSSASAADKVVVRVVLSNTGEADALDLDFNLSLSGKPAQLSLLESSSFTNLRFTPSRDAVAAFGLSVRAQEVAYLSFELTPTCPSNETDVVIVEARAGDWRGEELIVLSPADNCVLATESEESLSGCGVAGKGQGAWVLGLLVVVAAFVRKRRLGVLLGLIALSSLACDNGEATYDRSAPALVGFPCFPPELDESTYNDVVDEYDDMVLVPPRDGVAPFCIDRFEATIVGGVALSLRFEVPTTGVSYEQAQTACEAAGKRLCEVDEWQHGCEGNEASLYPYGDTYEPNMCNGFEANRQSLVQSGSMVRSSYADDSVWEAQGCVSDVGAYDMSGNAWEYVASSGLPVTVGGSFQSNREGLSCSARRTELANSTPANVGFRCCKDYETNSVE